MIAPLTDAIQRQALPGVAAPDVIHVSLGERHTAMGATALVLRNDGCRDRVPLGGGISGYERHCVPLGAPRDPKDPR